MQSYTKSNRTTNDFRYSYIDKNLLLPLYIHKFQSLKAASLYAMSAGTALRRIGCKRQTSAGFVLFNSQHLMPAPLCTGPTSDASVCIHTQNKPLCPSASQTDHNDKDTHNSKFDKSCFHTLLYMYVFLYDIQPTFPALYIYRQFC